MPKAFYNYMSYCNSLEFEDKPDYKYLKSLFFNELKEQNLLRNDAIDNIFDWTLRKLNIKITKDQYYNTP